MEEEDDHVAGPRSVQLVLDGVGRLLQAESNYYEKYGWSVAMVQQLRRGEWDNVGGLGSKVGVYRRAKLLNGQVVGSRAYHRAKSRVNDHVWLTYETERGRTPYVAEVQYYVMLSPTDEAAPDTAPLRLAVCHFYSHLTPYDDPDWGRVLRGRAFQNGWKYYLVNIDKIAGLVALTYRELAQGCELLFMPYNHHT
jgi:hypothetical protein